MKFRLAPGGTKLIWRESGYLLFIRGKNPRLKKKILLTDCLEHTINIFRARQYFTANTIYHLLNITFLAQINNNLSKCFLNKSFI